ncbi:HEAT repeat domain-containing protein [Micromonosporaceae bacterium B7E4]
MGRGEKWPDWRRDVFGDPYLVWHAGRRGSDARCWPRGRTGNRIDAAIALAGFAPTPGLVDALARAVRERHYLVRYHAANTLLRYAGRRRDVSDHPALFALIRSGDDDTEPDAGTTAQRAEAARRSPPPRCPGSR